jgi:integral membrane protein (TIGR01906 family)
MKIVMRWLIILAVPVVLVVGAVRLLSWPWFPTWEYRRPNFPDDEYGLSLAEREDLARRSVMFLNLPHDIERLEGLRLPDGSPAFTDRELEHMSDVKHVYDDITAGGLLALIVAISAGWALNRRGEVGSLWGGLSDGALLTLVGLGALGVLMLLSWNTFFTGLHQIFFESGTWRFQYSDTLIRLFPMRFWRDAGLIVVGIVSGTAFLIALIGRIMQRRLGSKE